MAKKEAVWHASAMSDPNVCTKCGRALESKTAVGEEILERRSDQHILATQRHFDGICPQCGPVRTRKHGHHSTEIVKRLSEHFSKNERFRIKAKLSKEQQKIFDLSMKGKRNATQAEVSAWKSLAVTTRATWVDVATAPSLFARILHLQSV